MSAKDESSAAVNSGENSDAAELKKQRRAAKLKNLKPFKKDVVAADGQVIQDERINREGRPKGTTQKDMLRREINRIVPGLDGKMTEFVFGEVIARQAVRQAAKGDLKAIDLVMKYDQDRPSAIGQGEQVPGTNVQVNVNAQANTQVVYASKEEEARRLVDRVRNFYGLGPKQPRTVTVSDSASASN